VETNTVATRRHRRIRADDAAQPRVGLGMPDPLPPGAGGQGRMRYLLDAAGVRPRGRRLLRMLSLVLAITGAAMLVYPLATDVYATEVLQSQLAQRYDSPEVRRRYITKTVRTGDPVTRIEIPALNVSALVVEGTSSAALRAGVGHYPGTAMPGQSGNVAIAGHRVTYGRPFNRMDQLKVGDTIRLESPTGTYTYRVVHHPPGVEEACPSGACWVTSPEDWQVVARTRRPSLTLTTCHPKGSAKQRLVIRALLIGVRQDTETV
jgi:sortase A